MASDAPPGRVLARFWDLSQDLLAVADLDGRFVHLNHRWTEVTGRSLEELCSRPFLDFVHPDDRERTARETAEMAEAGRASLRFENRYVCADGSLVWLSWNSMVAPDEGHIYAVATDVTAQRRSDRFLRTMQRVAEAANAADDPRTALAAGLREVCELTGWPAGHAYVPRSSDTQDPVLVSSGLWHLTDPERFAALQRASADTVFAKGEGLPGRVWASGVPDWVEDVTGVAWWVRGPADELGIRAALAFPARSGDEVTAVLEFFSHEPNAPDERLQRLMEHVGTQLGRVHDRTEAIAAQQRAIEVERQFLSMLSHELRSPLVSIKGVIGLLLSRWDELTDDRKRDFLDRAGGSADRMHRLVDEFLRLARHHEQGFEPRLEPVELAPLVERVLEDLHDPPTPVRAEVPSELVVEADVHFLHQVLSNLVANAQRHGAPPVQVQARRDDDHVEIDVRDHGDGVPPDFVPRLFERFTQAEPGNGGTGLGLAVCLDLVRAQGGALTYRAADPGARFTVRVPAG